jgi:acetyl-CoA C-acetyltransferase
MTIPRIGIIGIGQSAFKARRPDVNYPELVREAVTLALNDCKMELDEIEAVRYDVVDKKDTAIHNLIDEIVALYLSTLYKLRFLA